MCRAYSAKKVTLSPVGAEPSSLGFSTPGGAQAGRARCPSGGPGAVSGTLHARRLRLCSDAVSPLHHLRILGAARSELVHRGRARDVQPGHPGLPRPEPGPVPLDLLVDGGGGSPPPVRLGRGARAGPLAGRPALRRAHAGDHPVPLRRRGRDGGRGAASQGGVLDRHRRPGHEPRHRPRRFRLEPGRAADGDARARARRGGLPGDDQRHAGRVQHGPRVPPGRRTRRCAPSSGTGKGACARPPASARRSAPGSASCSSRWASGS